MVNTTSGTKVLQVFIISLRGHIISRCLFQKYIEQIEIKTIFLSLWQMISYRIYLLPTKSLRDNFQSFCSVTWSGNYWNSVFFQWAKGIDVLHVLFKVLQRRSSWNSESEAPTSYWIHRAQMCKTPSILFQSRHKGKRGQVSIMLCQIIKAG